jgi:hypothetical protein
MDSNFAMMVKIRSSIFDNPTIKQNGSIKLSDILNTNDFNGYTVTAKNAALNPYFSISRDKQGDQAIVYDYIPEMAKWDAAMPGLPVLTETLVLSKDGYANTEIKVTLRYTGSLYVKA